MRTNELLSESSIQRALTQGYITLQEAEHMLKLYINKPSATPQTCLFHTTELKIKPST